MSIYESVYNGLTGWTGMLPVPLNFPAKEAAQEDVQQDGVQGAVPDVSDRVNGIPFNANGTEYVPGQEAEEDVRSFQQRFLWSGFDDHFEALLSVMDPVDALHRVLLVIDPRDVFVNAVGKLLEDARTLTAPQRKTLVDAFEEAARRAGVWHESLAGTLRRLFEGRQNLTQEDVRILQGLLGATTALVLLRVIARRRKLSKKVQQIVDDELNILEIEEVDEEESLLDSLAPMRVAFPVREVPVRAASARAASPARLIRSASPIRAASARAASPARSGYVRAAPPVRAASPSRRLRASPVLSSQHLGQSLGGSLGYENYMMNRASPKGAKKLSLCRRKKSPRRC